MKTQADAEARKAKARATVLELIGGLPTEKTPLAARKFVPGRRGRLPGREDHL